MSHSRSPQIDRALAAFDWLPFERWIPDQLFNFMHFPNGQKCKVCDEIVPVSKQDDHCAMHVQQEKERRSEVKEEGMTMREKKSLDTEGLLAYLTEHPNGQTVAGIATATKKNINDVYKEVKVLLEQDAIQVVGTYKIPGKRGKPAKIYGKKEVA